MVMVIYRKKSETFWYSGNPTSQQFLHVCSQMESVLDGDGDLQKQEEGDILIQW